MVVKRIHVTYHLDADPDQHDTARRVHEMHAEHCPVARSLKGAVEISTSLEFE